LVGTLWIMPRTLITNVSTGPFTMPAPYSFVLPPGKSEVLGDTNENILALLGGAAAVAGIIALTFLPDTIPATSAPVHDRAAYRPLNWGTVGADQVVANNAPRAVFLGWAARDYNVGELFSGAYVIQATTATGGSWSEVALGIGEWVAGSAPTITPIGFVSNLGKVTSTGAKQDSVPLVATVPKGTGLWGIYAAQATVNGPGYGAVPADPLSSGIQCGLATAGWRPSAQLGVPATWTKLTTAAPGIMFSAPA
jgi:hypothetical protein